MRFTISSQERRRYPAMGKASLRKPQSGFTSLPHGAPHIRKQLWQDCVISRMGYQNQRRVKHSVYQGPLPRASQKPARAGVIFRPSCRNNEHNWNMLPCLSWLLGAREVQTSVLRTPGQSAHLEKVADGQYCHIQQSLDDVDCTSKRC